MLPAPDSCFLYYHFPSRLFPVIITLLTLALAAAGFVWGRIRADVVALIALVILAVSGVITTSEALSGFANPIVIMMVGCLLSAEPYSTPALPKCSEPDC